MFGIKLPFEDSYLWLMNIYGHDYERDIPRLFKTEAEANEFAKDVYVNYEVAKVDLKEFLLHRAEIVFGCEVKANKWMGLIVPRRLPSFQDPDEEMGLESFIDLNEILTMIDEGYF